jgi:hypothetical protein
MVRRDPSGLVSPLQSGSVPRSPKSGALRVCGRGATAHNNLDVATKKNPKQDTRLGVWSLLPHLGFWGLGGVVGDGVPPGLA